MQYLEDHPPTPEDAQAIQLAEEKSCENFGLSTADTMGHPHPGHCDGMHPHAPLVAAEAKQEANSMIPQPRLSTATGLVPISHLGEGLGLGLGLPWDDFVYGPQSAFLWNPVVYQVGEGSLESPQSL